MHSYNDVPEEINDNDEQKPNRFGLKNDKDICQSKRIRFF